MFKCWRGGGGGGASEGELHGLGEGELHGLGEGGCGVRCGWRVDSDGRAGMGLEQVY